MAQQLGVGGRAADLNSALKRPGFPIFFDATVSRQRVPTLSKAIEADKPSIEEKPLAPSVDPLSIATGLTYTGPSSELRPLECAKADASGRL